MNYVKSLLNLCSIQSLQLRMFHSQRTTITKPTRLKYLRNYPTLLVNPDGSTYTIRYNEPRRIIHLPFDLSPLSDSEKRARLDRRKAKTRVVIEKNVDKIKYDARKYLKYVKK